MKNTETIDKRRLSEQLAEAPHQLLDALIKYLGIRSDAALSRTLQVQPPVISKIRHQKLRIGSSLLVRMLEVTDLTLRDLHKLLGEETGTPPRTVASRRLRNAREGQMQQ